MQMTFSLRWGGEEPSESHTSWDCGIPANLLVGLPWCVSCSDIYDALLSAGQSQSSTCSTWICWLGACKVCCGCGISLCTLNKVLPQTCRPIDGPVRESKVNHSANHGNFFALGEECCVSSVWPPGGKLDQSSWRGKRKEVVTICIFLCSTVANDWESSIFCLQVLEMTSCYLPVKTRT